MLKLDVTIHTLQGIVKVNSYIPLMLVGCLGISQEIAGNQV